jgi:hypothetical protein
MVVRKLAKLKKILQSRTIVYLSLNILFLFLFILFMGLFFRRIRDSLPPTEIGSQKIVGYTQFFSYPFNLDTFIFFIFILSPVAIGLIFYLKDKRNKEKQKYAT